MVVGFRVDVWQLEENDCVSSSIDPNILILRSMACIEELVAIPL
jgi:hypothetical protein